jgi:phage-related protein
MLENDVLTTIQTDIREIKTILSERDSVYKERIEKNSTNIGSAFSELRDFKANITKDLHIVETDLIRNNEETHKLGDDLKLLRSEMSDLKIAVHDLKLSYAKISFFATLATAVVTTIIIKFFAG